MIFFGIVFIICLTLVILAYMAIKYKNVCKHQWEKVDEERCYDYDAINPEPNDQRYSHRKVILQCKNCGDIKTVKIC